MPPDFGGLAKDLGAAALSIFKGHVSTAWSSWSADDRKLVEDIAEDAAKVALMALTDPAGAAIEKRQIDAQIASVKVAANVEASRILWATLADILMKAATIALGAVL